MLTNTILVKSDVKRNNKTIFYEERIPVKEYEERQEAKLKQAKVMRFLDKIEKYKYNTEHAKGYCPKCHMLIPLSGVCDCGYHK